MMFKKMALLAIATCSIVLLSSGCASKQQSKLIQVEPEKQAEIKESMYEHKRKKELSKIIETPSIPVKTPDKILRVMMMPYVDKNDILQTSSFLFVKVDEGRWIFGEYLNDSKLEASQNLTPLSQK